MGETVSEAFSAELNSIYCSSQWVGHGRHGKNEKLENLLHYMLHILLLCDVDQTS